MTQREQDIRKAMDHLSAAPRQTEAPQEAREIPADYREWVDQHRQTLGTALLGKAWATWAMIIDAAQERHDASSAREQLAERLEALEKAATPAKWEGHVGEDATGYPCYFLHGFSGDEKRATQMHRANLSLAISLRNHLPEILAALRGQAQDVLEPDELEDKRRHELGID